MAAHHHHPSISDCTTTQLAATETRLPRNRTAIPGLYLAGEYTEDSSINGAMRSGEGAAGAVLGDRRREGK